MTESNAHKEKKRSVCSELNLNGFDADTEVPFSDAGYRLDVYGCNSDGKEICVEVGRVKRDKVEWAKDRFDIFRHVGYENDGQFIKSIREPQITNTLNISQEAMNKVEEIQESKFIEPTKRSIADKAIDMLHGEMVGTDADVQADKQIADNN